MQRKKLGVQLEPPALLLLYKESGLNKKRTMPIRELNPDSDCLQLANRLAARHQAHIGPINIVRLEKMIRIAQEHLRGVSVSASLANLRHEFEINPAEDLNKLSDRELAHRKAIMDLSFQKNRLERDHPDFVYDKQVDFAGTKKATDWDSSDSQNNSEESTPVNSPIRASQPLLSAARKGLFGLDEADQVEEQDNTSATVLAGQAGSSSTAPAPQLCRQEDEANKSDRSVSCGEPGGGDTDSDFW